MTASLKRAARQFLSKGSRDFLRSVYYLPADIRQRMAGNDGLTPPKSKSASIGTLDFRESGERHLKYLKDYANLSPSDKVLDIGCGYGRMAVPMLPYLDNSGSYDGMDVTADVIKWCDRIAKRRPNFNFKFADIYNSSYNPHGARHAKDYALPYPDGQFDVVLAISVFSHIMPDETQNYLRQISRILKPGGRTFLTFFLLNEESKQAIDRKTAGYDFKFNYENYSVVDKNAPDYAIAYKESLVRQWFEENGLKVRAIHYGNWARGQSETLGQDIIVAVKQ